jgi:hypothetical protein
MILEEILKEKFEILLTRIEETKRKTEQLSKEALLLKDDVRRAQTEQRPTQRPSFTTSREWSSFETDLVRCDLEAIIDRRTRQFGRSPNSLVWKMWRELDKMRV